MYIYLDTLASRCSSSVSLRKTPSVGTYLLWYTRFSSAWSQASRSGIKSSARMGQRQAMADSSLSSITSDMNTSCDDTYVYMHTTFI